MQTKQGLLSIRSSELTVKNAHQGTQVTIARKDKELYTHLYGSILKVRYSVDANKGLDEESASETLDMLLRDFYYLKYEEFLLIFRMMSDGKFGNFYERLKAAEFTRCFEEYDRADNRLEMFVSLNKSINIDTLPPKETEAEQKAMYDEWLKKNRERLEGDSLEKEKERKYQEIRESYNSK